MRNTYTIEERNRIAEEHLWCIKAVIKQNRALIDAARLDRDDVFQDLSIRLIRAVGNYDPDKGTLKQHIFSQLHYELLSCARPYRMTGITGAPKDLRSGEIVSLDSYEPTEYLTEERLAA